MATSISYDGDHIIIGDVYQNITVLKKCNEEENRKEKLDEKDLINIKKVLVNKLEAHVVGAYSLNQNLQYNHSDLSKGIDYEGT